MNQSFKKEYNEKGECINMYKGDWLHNSPNRQQRRAELSDRKQHNNRRSALGRRLQVVNGKQIAHETPNALSRKVALFNFFSRIEVLKSKWHSANPEFQKKQK